MPHITLPIPSHSFEDAESKEKKLKNANEVIEQMKEEITSSRDSEKNLKIQLLSTQNRLICLHKILKKVINVCGQQRQNEKISQQIEVKVEKISETIKQIRDKLQSFLQHVSNETNYLKEIKNLKSALAEKNREHDLMKMEITSLTIGKRNMEIANQQKLRSLETELEKLKQKEIESKANYSETLQYYQHQLEEKEKKLKVYEKERHNFLDDFEFVEDQKLSFEDFTFLDSTDFIINERERLPKSSSECDESQRKPEEEHTQISRGLSYNEEPKLFNLRKRKDERIPRMSNKQKPQLEFLTQSRPSSQTGKCATNERKRRLFSTNCNHYTE